MQKMARRSCKNPFDSESKRRPGPFSSNSPEWSRRRRRTPDPFSPTGLALDRNLNGGQTRDSVLSGILRSTESLQQRVVASDIRATLKRAADIATINLYIANSTPARRSARSRPPFSVPMSSSSRRGRTSRDPWKGFEATRHDDALDRTEGPGDDGRSRGGTVRGQSLTDRVGCSVVCASCGFHAGGRRRRPNGGVTVDPAGHRVCPHPPSSHSFPYCFFLDVRPPT